MTEFVQAIHRAIVYMNDVIYETDEIIGDCSESLKAELIEQKEHFIIAVVALKEMAVKVGEENASQKS